MNYKVSLLRCLTAAIAATLLLSLTACSALSEQEITSTACAQVGGTWELIADTDNSQCGGSGKKEKMVYQVTQKQCQLSAGDGSSGVSNGSDIKWQVKSWSVNGGEVSYPEVTGHVYGKQVSGVQNWTWSDGYNECSGTTKVTGTILGKKDAGNAVYSLQKIEEKNPMLSASEGAIAHTFSVNAPDAKAVYLAGEMSDWKDDVFKMQRGANGNWDLTLYLQQGAWQYKFVVDGQWFADKSNPKNTDDGYQGLNSVIVLGKEIAALTLDPNIAHGSLINNHFDSKILGENSPFAVYLPPGYSADSQKNYPLLLLLHGYGNDQKQWIRDGKIQNFMDNLVHSGIIQPFIIVMPYGGTSQYIGKTENYIMDELLPYVREQYRIKPGKEATAISGLSMGGFGAFYLAHRHQDVFGLSVPLSGYFDMNNYPDFNPQQIIMEPELHIYCGKDDHVSFTNNQALVKQLKSGGLKFTYETSAGGHTWRYWNSVSTDLLTVISDFFNKQV